MGKISINRTGVNQWPNPSEVIPNQKQKGLLSHADADPVIAKTINIRVSWKLVSIPQRCFSLFIFIYNEPVGCNYTKRQFECFLCSKTEQTS